MEPHSNLYRTTLDNLKTTLDQYGVAILPQVIDDEECHQMVSGVNDFLEHITQSWDIPYDRNEVTTWRQFHQLQPMHGMLLQHYGVGQAQVSWNLRQNPKIVEVFSSLWNTKPEELLVSFDGLSFSPPPEKTNRGWNGKSWLHTDQSFTRNNFECVQSWITGLPVREDDATLMVLEGSHKYHEECATKFQITDNDDWYLLKEQELNFYQEEKGCRPVRITCGPGDLVLWDSRTIHCGVGPLKSRDHEAHRAIVYLCYLPRLGTPNKILKKRRKAFEELRTTNHHPQKSLLFSKNPRNYGTPVPHLTQVTSPVLGELGRKLVGY